MYVCMYVYIYIYIYIYICRCAPWTRAMYNPGGTQNLSGADARASSRMPWTSPPISPGGKNGLCEIRSSASARQRCTVRVIPAVQVSADAPGTGVIVLVARVADHGEREHHPGARCTGHCH